MYRRLPIFFMNPIPKMDYDGVIQSMDPHIVGRNWKKLDRILRSAVIQWTPLSFIYPELLSSDMASDWLEDLRNVSKVVFPGALDRKQMEDMLIYLARHLNCQVDYNINLGKVVDNFEGDAEIPKPSTSSVTIDGFFTMDEEADQVIDFKCEKYADDRTKQKSMAISMDEESIEDYTEDTFETWMQIHTLTATYLSRGYHKT